ncbi:MAG: hypothetical protein IKM16_04775 [Clostridia bacterium]|nr:hypothetical protein [Clostridia bacterium]MBR6773960.1 hypothetical protein [Clostridia bacterium]
MDKKKTLLQKFKALKGKEIIIALIAVAIMLIIYFSSSTSPKSTVSVLGSDYCAELQTKIERTVVNMSGDKNATVVINWNGSVRNEIAKSESVSQNSSTSSPVIISGQNGSTPVILRKKYPEVIGVVVVVKNYDDVKLRVDLVQMLSTLLGISPQKVAVFSSK